MTILIETTGTVVNIVETSPPKGEKGDQGEPGLAGHVNDEYPAGEILSGHRIVIVQNDQVFYADNSIAGHAFQVFGMTTGAVLQGAYPIIQTYGVIEEPSWNWDTSLPIWLGSNGLLQKTPPSSGFSLIIGFPVSPTSMFINIREPIFLI